MQREINVKLNVLNEPACRHLLSKGMFVTGQLDPAADPHVGDGNCWCNQTQHVLGPDKELVDRENCNSLRPCYEPRL